MKKLLTTAVSVLSIGAVLMLSGCSSTDEAVNTNTDEVIESADGENPLFGQTIVVGCSSTFVPFESIVMAEDGSVDYVGMNVELIETILEKNGAEVEFMDMPFKSLIGAIQTGQIDMNISGMMPTEERMEALDFSEIYFYPRNAIVFDKSNNFETLEDLEGKTVAYAFGTNYQQIVEAIDGVTGTAIQGSPACVEEVKSGRSDATVMDGAGAVEYLKNNDNLTLSLLDKTDDCFAIGFPKDSPYYDVVNDTLIEMMSNGELDEIISNYLTEDFIL